MNKSIILFCDGTWNKPEDQNGDTHPTNVLRFMRALKPRADERHQVVYYDSGIGTGGLWDRYVGGAFGLGISNNIMDAYRFLANNWAAGDSIYLFGFSRGAYTVRSLAGFIDFMGLLHKENMPMFPLCYQYYRIFEDERPAFKQAQLVESIRKTTSEADRTPEIEFLGVWETVGALGITFPGMQRLSRRWVGFHDTQLGSRTRHAVHAIGVDETRTQFAANLWTHRSGTPADSKQAQVDNERVLQVWFPGSHNEVGGGYQNCAISDQALGFMIGQAERRGLKFYYSAADFTPSSPPEDWPIRDEFRGVYRLFGRYYRPIGDVQRSAQEQELAVNEKIHESAVARLAGGGSFINENNLEAALKSGVDVFHERCVERTTSPDQKPATIIYARFGGQNTQDEVNPEPDTVATNCSIDNYSELGARVSCVNSLPLQPGATVSIETGSALRRDALVRWQHNNTVGLQFLRPPAA